MKKLLAAQLLFVASAGCVYNVIDFMNFDIHLEKHFLLRKKKFFLLTLDILIKQKSFFCDFMHTNKNIPSFSI